MCVAFSSIRSAGLFMLLGGLAASTALSGCSGMFKEPPGVSYAKSVTEMGIHPVYPPREDLQVGDIYAVEVNRNRETARLRTVYLESIDLTSTIKEYLQRIYGWGATTPAKDATAEVIATISARLPEQRDAPGEDSEVLQLTDLQALPITSFPAIEVDTGMSFGIQASSSNLAAVLGLNAAQSTKMSLQFGMVTSYAVPIPKAYKALKQFCAPTNDQFRTECNTEDLKGYIAMKYQVDSDSIKAAVPLMVSKVYMARAISYTSTDATLIAAAASIASEEGKSAPALIDGKLLEEALDKDEDAAALIRALAEYQKTLNTTVNANKDTSGVSVSVASVTRTSVTFREIFQRPVVIGYEGVYLDPDTAYYK